jgi:ankyrin repeat protein
MGACSFGDPETVRLLLAAGAGVNFERSDRWTALMAAAYGGHSHIVSMLLNNGASANVVTEWGYSPSALAAINGNAGIVRMLRARGDVIRVPWDDLTRQ